MTFKTWYLCMLWFNLLNMVDATLNMLCNIFQKQISIHLHVIWFPFTSSRENSRFYGKPPFCFFKEKHILKEVLGFWWLNQDCASTSAELCKEFNTRVFLNNYFITPLFLIQTDVFMANHHFVSWFGKKQRWSSFEYCNCVPFLINAPYPF